MRAGDQVRVEMTKWGDRPHWRFVGFHLGSDEYGDWIGFPAGTHHARPGLEFVSEVDSVTLLPRGGWYAATFHEPGIWCDLYVDIATPPEWHGDVVRAVDLDLDIIRWADVPGADPPAVHAPGEVYVDDEDEFAEHQVAFGYPADVVEAARKSCDQVLAAVVAGEAPYDGTHRRWLDILAGLNGP